MTNGKVEQVPVEIGASSDTQTEITSGLHEGDAVVVGTVSTRQTSSGASPFSRNVFGGGRGFATFGGGGRGRGD